MKTSHTYLLLPLLCLFLLFAPLTATVTAQASGSARQANATTEVTLYDMDSSYAEVVSVPASMSRSYRILQDGMATYRVTSGRNYVQISADGLVTTARTYWKKGNGYSYSVSEGGRLRFRHRLRRLETACLHSVMRWRRFQLIRRILILRKRIM